MTDITAPGGAERSEPEESTVAETALEQARGPMDWFHRWVPAHVTTQVILINFIGLLVFVSGILYFNQSRQGLIDARVQSLMTQAQIMASAVASSATIDTDQILFDPERLLEQQAPETGTD